LRSSFFALPISSGYRRGLGQVKGFFVFFVRRPWLSSTRFLIPANNGRRPTTDHGQRTTGYPPKMIRSSVSLTSVAGR
jgi:hypothetical protein